MSVPNDNSQTAHWENLYAAARALLGSYGAEDAHAKGDFFVLDDNWGTNELRVEINNLMLLEPAIIQSLQDMLRELPGWKIVIALDVPGTEKTWPSMGLVIRSNEIIDGLQRQYFPTDFRDLKYEGARPGTDRD